MEQAGHVDVDLYFALNLFLGPVWYICGSKCNNTSCVQMSEVERAMFCKSGVFMKRRVVSRGLRYNVRRCGSVGWGVLLWRTAWCSLVSVAFGECSLELYFGRKVGSLSEERGSKLVSVVSG